MNQSGLVHKMQRLAYLRQDSRDLFSTQRPVGNHRFERASLDVRCNIVGHPILLSIVEDWQDMSMSEPIKCVRLPPEAPIILFILLHHEFERVYLLALQFACQVDLRHTAACQAMSQLIQSEPHTSNFF